jgi:hypothetical protein
MGQGHVSRWIELPHRLLATILCILPLPGTNISQTYGNQGRHTPDFSPPLFFSAQRKSSDQTTDITAETAVALLNGAWSDLQNSLGTNSPKALLVCDNLNQPAAIAGALTTVSGNIPWAGVSHTFNMGLPFDASLIARLAHDKRGISLLALAGNVDVQLELIPNLDPEPFSLGENPQEEMQRRPKLVREQFTRRIEPVLARFNFPQSLLDHLLFLMEPGANWASSFITDELENRLGGKAQVEPVIGASGGSYTGDGVTYVDGRVFSNAIALVRLSGNLPLPPDYMHTVALAASRLSNAPSINDLHGLHAREPARIACGEVTKLVRQLAFSFGPHPMEKVAQFFGEQWIHFLMEADKVDVFRVAANDLDAPDIIGPKNPEGYKLLNVGRTLDGESARSLAKALLGPQSHFMSLNGCGFDPGIIFQLWRGKEYARLVVCFHCNEATLAFYDADGNVVHRNHGFHFTGHSTLAELARKALPDDRTLDKL